MTELLDAWKSVSAGSPVVVLLEGGSGYGLTRVCDELVSRVAVDGTVFRGAGAGVPNDFATAAELFEGIGRSEGAAGAAPEALAGVARVVPSLTSEFKFLPAAVGDDAALRDALVQTLAAVGEEQAVLIVLDDAHAADEATQRLLSGVVPRLTGRVMLLLAVDEAARDGSPALSALRGGRAAPPTSSTSTQHAAFSDGEAGNRGGVRARLEEPDQSEVGRLANRRLISGSAFFQACRTYPS